MVWDDYCDTHIAYKLMETYGSCGGVEPATAEPDQNFDIHCESYDDNLGVHTVSPNRVYGFHFDPDIWGTTLFLCEVRTHYGVGNYNIYEYRRDHNRCGDRCIWNVTRSGVYGYADVPNKPVIIFKWE
ncbi:hypothetical protein SAY86_009962 [Trapa natans]|uniref:S-protein homolog n=1 Tax=Trapa natans TaxID=22666 RepID=A0AAN7L5S1_TRANT|nr:hypothetical protein SAY86_009962 [Trapa natans]